MSKEKYINSSLHYIYIHTKCSVKLLVENDLEREKRFSKPLKWPTATARQVLNYVLYFIIYVNTLRLSLVGIN